MSLSIKPTDENLSMPLRVATFSVPPNFKRLVKQKTYKKSHSGLYW